MKRSTSGGQEVKDQGHTTPKLDLEAWRRHQSRPIRSSRFPSLYSNQFIAVNLFILLVIQLVMAAIRNKPLLF